MRRTGAQECNNYLGGKAITNSLNRIPIEINVSSYERNRSLFTTMKTKEIYN